MGNAQDGEMPLRYQAKPKGFEPGTAAGPYSGYRGDSLRGDAVFGRSTHTHGSRKVESSEHPSVTPVTKRKYVRAEAKALGRGESGSHSSTIEEDIDKYRGSYVLDATDAKRPRRKLGRSKRTTREESKETPTAEVVSTAGTPLTPLHALTGEAMRICWQFWKENVEGLPRDRQKELALLLYSHMFQRIATGRRLFIKEDIESTALKYLDMVGWLIRRLKSSDTGSLMDSLVALGVRHSECGVKIEYFQPMLDALHATLADHFKHTYTIRVKFCMEQLFTVAANVMTGRDVATVFATRYSSSNHLRFLNSLEECLADAVGQEYLTRFLVQSFCGELVEFLEVYKQYRGALSDLERHYLATKIVQQFLTESSKSELMISEELKAKVQRKLAASHRRAPKGAAVVHLPGDLFDPIYEWVIRTIEENPWPKFRKTLRTVASRLISAHKHHRDEEEAVGRYSDAKAH